VSFTTTPCIARAVIVGGFAVPKWALIPLRRDTDAAGIDARIFVHHWGLDCSQTTYIELEKMCLDRASKHGPILIAAYSRGGQFAKVLAVRHPHNVRGVVTLGTPFSPGLSGLGSTTARKIRLLAKLGDYGMPGVVTNQCARGSCCNEFWDDLRRPWPSSVALYSIYAENDTVVDGRAVADPAAAIIWVPGNHQQLVVSARTRRLAVEALLKGSRT
jgi:pimeloyl-ACP methyl ester carboxylesterase